ncbi:coxsackievirus and adenovirus receptor homolog [Trachinotus anak]|uniref:coxsackievirus and adenovirus receptor homolog n=1 Tax=Trachinotus anak TaxID=443729 RepID=UPI0039F25217
MSTVYAGQADSATLNCHFTLSDQDVGPIDIEWSLKSPDVQREVTVIWYAVDQIYANFKPFEGRVNFMSLDPVSGNASIVIRHLKFSDSGTYQCKVKKLPGYGSILIRLAVMERPSKPNCYLEGEVRLHNKVVLKCNSKHSSLPIWYTWSKPHGPQAFSIKPMSGDLSLTISTEDVLGDYICTLHSIFGTEECVLTLTLPSSVNSAVIPAVASVSALVFVISTCVIVICCYRKRDSGEDMGNDIFEDELPPHRLDKKKLSPRETSPEQDNCCTPCQDQPRCDPCRRSHIGAP